MKKLFLSLSILCSVVVANAQWQADGSTFAGTITMKDINNNSYDMVTMLNAGKHVILDFSATWCGPCWAYHTSHVLDTYNDKYGPSGTSVKDAQVFLYEVDQATTLADLQGTGSSTVGDWITGTTHPICNESATSTMLFKFLAPGTTSYGVPAVFVVCKDKKFYEISTSLTTEPALRSFIASKCGVGPLANEEVMDIDFSYNIFPNPAASYSTIHMNLDKTLPVSYSVSNSIGQVVYALPVAEMSEGTNDLQINTSTLANGIYFINLKVGSRMIKTKLMVNHD